MSESIADKEPWDYWQFIKTTAIIIALAVVGIVLGLHWSNQLVK